jgi:hypothetical protein
MPPRRADKAPWFFPLVFSAGAALSGCGDTAWSATGKMIAARALHSATPLNNGHILFAGGKDGKGPLSSAELYDIETDTWSPARAMNGARQGHTATLLFDVDDHGHVLIAGGSDGNGAVMSAELYDPQKNAWSPAESMKEARQVHTATLLSNGRVLIAGGDDGNALLDSAVLYDPAGDLMSPWVAVANKMPEARRHHTATLLTDGKVLIAGGEGSGGALSSAVLYDPARDPMDPWVVKGTMKAARAGHTATLLLNGKVLIAGGRNGSVLPDAELYDPTKDQWSAAAPMAEARSGHTATLLENGEVLVAGGDGRNGVLGSAELYDPGTDPGTDPWSDAGSVADVRAGHTATLLAGGAVLIAGGGDGGALSSAELYQPGTQCRTLDDCPTSLVCNAQKQCVPPEEASLENGCAAAGGWPSAGGGALLAGVASLLTAFARRRAAPVRRRALRAHHERSL